MIGSTAFAGKYNKTLSIGDKAPAFEGIPAAIGDKDAAALSLASIKEDVVVVVFLANHCPMVGTYDDRVVDLAKKFEGKSVKLVSICVSGKGYQKVDDLDAIKTRGKEKGYNFAYGYDASQKIGKAYGASTTPEFFVLDKARTVRYIGALDDSADEDKVTKTYVVDAVNALLSGETIEVTETRPRGCGIGYAK
jgi:peroxiredoxin